MRIREATIWNPAFWDGNSIIWPKADILRGITKQIIERQIVKTGVRSETREIDLQDINRFSGAALMNSWTPHVPVRSIGTVDLPISSEFGEILRAAYRAEPPVSI